MKSKMSNKELYELIKTESISDGFLKCINNDIKIEDGWAKVLLGKAGFAFGELLLYLKDNKPTQNEKTI